MNKRTPGIHIGPMIELVRKTVPNFLAPLILALLILGAMALPLDFSYERSDVISGSLWQLVSANLAHLNWPHLSLNVAGLVSLTALHFAHYRPTTYIALTVTCAMFVTTGLLFFQTQVENYAGLSGVLHGLLIWGALKDIVARLFVGWILLLGIALKLGHECWFGPSQLTEDMIAAPVISAAHVYGALGGLVFFAVETVWQKARA